VSNADDDLSADASDELALDDLAAFEIPMSPDEIERLLDDDDDHIPDAAA
jgi:hypothetical protein